MHSLSPPPLQNVCACARARVCACFFGDECVLFVLCVFACVSACVCVRVGGQCGYYTVCCLCVLLTLRREANFSQMIVSSL